MSASSAAGRSAFSAADEALERAVASGSIPGAVAAVTDRHRLLHEAAFGTASPGGEPMRPDTVFRIASMTKPITTIALMMLHEQRKLDLDDALAAHLPGFEQPGVLVSFDERTGEYTVREAARPVTIRHLLTHTSGFGYWFLNREVLLEAKGRVEFFRAPFLMHDPGEAFSYGVGTDIVGLIVEPLSGLPIDRFVAERIAAPLGLRDLRYPAPEPESRLAALCERRGDSFVDVSGSLPTEPPRGGSGLHATARDYAAILRMLLNGGRLDDGTRLLAEKSVAAAVSNQIGALFARRQTTAYPRRSLDFVFLDGTQKFGFNVMIETRDRPDGRRAGSYGWAGVFNTYFWVDPAAEIAAVLMMQMSPFCDPACIAAYREFERGVYRAIGA